MKFVLTCCLARSEMFHTGLCGSAIIFGIIGSLLQSKQNISLQVGFLSGPSVKISLLPADFKTELLMLLDFRTFYFKLTYMPSVTVDILEYPHDFFYQIASVITVE